MSYHTSAIVIGGGIGGLAAASAALRHFDQVTLVDKDDLASKIASETILETKKRRSGVPHYTQPHILLAGGSRALERLLPGFTKELCSRGARSYDAGKGLFVYDFGAPFQRGIDAGVEVFAASRRLINEVCQDVVLEQGKDRLILREKTKVAGLFWERPSSQPESYNVTNRVRGVQGVILNSGEKLRADLVIVSNGRTSQLPSWLKEVGLEVPPQLKVDSQMNYASRWMRLPEDFDPEKEFYSALVNARPAMARGGVALVLEDNLLQISMNGFEGERAPLDHEGWMEYAASLPDQTLFNLAQRCEPIGPITRFASAPNTAHQYHTMKFPEGLVVIGDAFAALNPFYGQGMSVAAQQAVLLEETLGKVLSGKSGETRIRHAVRATLSPRLHKLLHKKVNLAWQMSTCEDMRWPGVKIEGMAKPTNAMYNYLDAIMLSCQQSKKVWKQLLRVTQFVTPPSGMFTPLMVMYATKNIVFTKKKKLKSALVNDGDEVGEVPQAPRFANPIRTTTSIPPFTAASISRSDTTDTWSSDGGKDIDFITVEQPGVRGAVAV
ncbi:hypothetical protein Ndes2526A_g07675 [Nannochloris sp. 'desiccata']